MTSQFIHGAFHMKGLAVPIPCYVCKNECYVRSIPIRKKVLCPRCAAAAHENERLIKQGLLKQALTPRLTYRDGKIIRSNG